MTKKGHLKEGSALEGEGLDNGIRTSGKEGFRSQTHLEEETRTSNVKAT